MHVTAAAQQAQHCLQPTHAVALQARQGVQPTLPPACGRSAACGMPAATLPGVPRREVRALVRVVSRRDRNCQLEVLPAVHGNRPCRVTMPAEEAQSQIARERARAVRLRRPAAGDGQSQPG